MTDPAPDELGVTFRGRPEDYHEALIAIDNILSIIRFSRPEPLEDLRYLTSCASDITALLRSREEDAPIRLRRAIGTANTAMREWENMGPPPPATGFARLFGRRKPRESLAAKLQVEREGAYVVALADLG